MSWCILLRATSGAVLWLVLGGVLMWVLAEFLVADRDRDLPALMESTILGVD